MKESIVLFDGVCNLCCASALFIIKRDKNKRFKFASLQSDFAQQLFQKQQFDSKGIDSVAFYENGKLHVRSTAALKIARKLDGLWMLFYGFILIPAPLRDVAYNFIARNRYKWFGKKESCTMPEPGMRERFLS